MNELDAIDMHNAFSMVVAEENVRLQERCNILLAMSVGKVCKICLASVDTKSRKGNFIRYSVKLPTCSECKHIICEECMPTNFIACTACNRELCTGCGSMEKKTICKYCINPICDSCANTGIKMCATCYKTLCIKCKVPVNNDIGYFECKLEGKDDYYLCMPCQVKQELDFCTLCKAVCTAHSENVCLDCDKTICKICRGSLAYYCTKCFMERAAAQEYRKRRGVITPHINDIAREKNETPDEFLEESDSIDDYDWEP